MPRAVMLSVVAACVAPDPADVAIEPWRIGTPLPAPRPDATAAELGTRLAISTDVLVLDTLEPEGQWMPLPPAPVARVRAGFAGVGGSLYLFGGFDQNREPRGEAFVLDAGAASWRTILSIPRGHERGAAAVVVSPPHIFLIGGVGQSGALASSLAFNVATTRPWSVLPDLPVARSHAAAMRRSDGTLIVAGGFDDRGRPLADAWALPIGAPRWRRLAPMPIARGDCAYGAVVERMICAGGRRELTALRVVDLYDANTDTWSALPELPVERTGAAGTVIGTQLYVAGGAASATSEPTDTLLIFALLSTVDALP